MIARPHLLSIVTTHTCTAACDHCCFACTPKVRAAIPIDRIHLYLDQAAEVESLRVIVFTGGECFLLGSKLDDLVRHASRNGHAARFVSNGYWAHTPEHARKRIDRLVSRGLNEATFSTGDMHAKYVKPEYVRNGAMACAEAGVPVYVLIELFAEAAFDVHEFVSEPRFKKLLAEKKILLSTAPWMKFDGSSELSFSSRFHEAKDALETGCESIFDTLTINPAEDLIACSGLSFEKTPQLHLGSLKTRTMKEILTATPDDFIKIWIHVQGPLAIMKYAHAIDPSIVVPRDQVHVCDHCRSMYRDEKVLRVVRNNPPPEKDKIIAAFKKSVARMEKEQKADLDWFANSRRKLYRQRSRSWTPRQVKKTFELAKG